MKFLALDVGGTAVKSAIVDELGNITEYRSTPTTARAAEGYCQNAIAVASTYSGYDVATISMTGQIDHKTQTTLARNNGRAIERASLPVGRIISEALSLPTYVLNDANAAALGEAVYGAGREYRDFLCLTYGTGVGGGIIRDRRLLTGTRGIAGELGHLVTHAGGVRCRCGHRGCYEEYASTTALLRRARKILPYLNNAAELFDRIPDTPQLTRTVDRWLDEIVEGLVSLSYVFDPPCFILGGGVMERAELLDRIREKFRKRIIPSFNEIKITKAELGNRAGMLGAVAFAHQCLTDSDLTAISNQKG